MKKLSSTLILYFVSLTFLFSTAWAADLAQLKQLCEHPANRQQYPYITALLFTFQRDYNENTPTQGEQWAYQIEIANSDNVSVSCNISIALFDKEGFMITSPYLFVGKVAPFDKTRRSGQIHLREDDVQATASVTLNGTCK